MKNKYEFNAMALILPLSLLIGMFAVIGVVLYIGKQILEVMK